MAKAENSPQFIEALEALEASAGEWTAQCEDAVARVESCRAAMRSRMEPDERALREILEPPQIKSFGSVTLYPNRIVMNGVVRQLAPGVQTLAETRGNINRAKRSLLTRTAVGVFTFPMAAGLGFFATPKTKKHDDREVVLIVEGSDWAEMTTYAPALQRDVIRFAKEIEATADAWMTGQRERAPRAAALAGRIREIQDESADLDEALDHLDAVRTEPATRDALDRVQTLIADEDLKVSRDIRKRIDAVQATVGRLGAVPPPPTSRGQELTQVAPDHNGRPADRSAGPRGASIGQRCCAFVWPVAIQPS